MAANAYVSESGAAGSYGRASGAAIRLQPAVTAQIADVEPAETPLLTTLNKLTRSVMVKQPEFNVQEQWPINNVLQGTTVEAAEATTAAFDVADTSFCIPSQVVQNTRTGEQMYITAIASATTLTVTRGFGTTAAAATVATDRYIILGTALESGQDAIQNLMRASGSHLQYAQLFSQKAGINDIALRQGVFGPTEEVQLNNQMIVEYKKQKNRQFLLGEPNKATVTNHEVYVTGGVRHWAQLYNDVDLGGTFTWKMLAHTLSSGIRFGGQGERVGITSQRLWVEISSAMEKFVQTDMGQSTLGVEVLRVKFPGSMLNLIVDYTLEESGLDDELIVYDPRYVDRAVFQGETAERDIETPGSHRTEWQISSREGVQQRLPISSIRVQGLQDAA